MPELLGSGKCLNNIGGSSDKYPINSYHPRDFAELKQYVIDMCVNDKFPHMQYDKLDFRDQGKVHDFMSNVCHDTINDWKKIRGLNVH